MKDIQIEITLPVDHMYDGLYMFNISFSSHVTIRARFDLSNVSKSVHNIQLESVDL